MAVLRSISIRCGITSAILCFSVISKPASALDCTSLLLSYFDCKSRYYKLYTPFEQFQQHCGGIGEQLDECRRQEKIQNTEAERKLDSMSMGELQAACERVHLYAQGQCSVVDRNSMVSIGICQGALNEERTCWSHYNQRRASGE